MRTVPAVGSTSRVRQRTSVDLPLPDSPITTNVSPRVDVEVDVADGGDVAGARLQLAPGEVGLRRADDALRLRGPKTFHSPRTEIVGPATDRA